MAASKPKTLCVDDDADILHGFRLHLRQEVTVHVAESGAEGLKLLRQHREVAVIVADMRMPIMDGAECLSRAKEPALGPATVKIFVEDNGCGIPDVVKARIFDPYFTTKQVGRGSGQGLAISRAIVVDRHKGEFEVESLEGHGTTFIITLPTLE